LPPRGPGKRLAGAVAQRQRQRPVRMALAPCANGCGRPSFGRHPTCCTRCTGPGGPHAGDCEGKAAAASAASAPAAGAAVGSSPLTPGLEVVDRGALGGVSLLGPGLEAAETAAPRVLRVRIVGARGLRKADWHGLSDPYCVCTLAGRPREGFRTQIVEKTLEPRWNHERVVLGCTPGSELSFTVLDWDRAKEHDLLGRAHLEAAHFLQGGFDGELRLRDAGSCQDAYLHVRVAVLAGAAAEAAVAEAAAAAEREEAERRQQAGGPGAAGSGGGMLGGYGKKIADAAVHGLGHGFGAGIGAGAAHRIWQQIDRVMR